LSELLELVCAHRVIPVIPAIDARRAQRLGSALKAGGLPVAEVTLRTAGATELLRTLAADTDLLVGAGTVVRAAQVDIARDAGASFVVTPGFSASVVHRCDKLGLPVIPGVATAAEIIAALDHNCELLKFFPAQAAGGTAMISALAAPFPSVRFVPTGGINADNAASYLRMAPVAAVGGSWMVAPATGSKGDFAEVERLVAAAVALAREATA
jgi:2-dehydro-3-deoxyphosphogluconate aldolase/(4S)-4-hydroxy-2-oxoglutarate aldolase